MKPVMENETIKTERRSFRAHQNLINIIIKDQAGTLGKAIGEGVMNSVDAGASKVVITLTESKVTIVDDGDGIQEREKIETFFEELGHPHEEGDAKYGRYRIGRGQMFCFGRNTWRTGEFKLFVDFNNMGLGYDLTSGFEKSRGTKIEIDLYEKLTSVDTVSTEKELEKLLKFVPLPVTINGRRITKDTAKEKWTEETDDFYLRLRAIEDYGTVTYYNGGVLVEAENSRGVSGVVVTKGNFAVNTARNQIKRSCPIYKEIQKRIAALKGEEKKSTRLTMAKAIDMLEEVLRGRNLEWSERKLRIVPTIHASRASMYMIGRRINECNKGSEVPVIFAKEDDSQIDKIDQAKAAVILSSRILDEIDMDPEEIAARIFQVVGTRGLKPTLRELSDFDHLISGKVEIIPPKEYSQKEKDMMEVLGMVGGKIFPCAMRHNPDLSERETFYNRSSYYRAIRLGISKNAMAWTDGGSYIAFERKTLKGAPSLNKWHELVNILIHEYAHNESSEGSHEHTLQFYRTYHEITMECGNLATAAWRQYAKMREERAGKEPSREITTIEKIADRQDSDEGTKNRRDCFEILEVDDGDFEIAAFPARLD